MTFFIVYSLAEHEHVLTTSYFIEQATDLCVVDFCWSVYIDKTFVCNIKSMAICVSVYLCGSVVSLCECWLIAWKKTKYVQAKNFHHPKIYRRWFLYSFFFTHVLCGPQTESVVGYNSNRAKFILSLSHIYSCVSISLPICQPVLLPCICICASIVNTLYKAVSNCQKPDCHTLSRRSMLLVWSWLSVKCARHWNRISYFEIGANALKLVGIALV